MIVSPFVPSVKGTPQPFRPFDQLPRDLRNDRRLTDGDVRLVAALIGYARNKPDCFPSNATLASELGITRRTVQNRLRRIEAAGWIRCLPVGWNRTCRVIVLTWRSEGPPVKPVSPLPVKPVSPEGYRVVKEKEIIPERDGTIRPEKPPEPPQSPRFASEAPSRPVTPIPAIEAVPERPDLKTSPRASERPSTDKPRRRPTLTLDDLRKLAPSDPILAAELARRTAPRPEPKPEPANPVEMIRRLRECPSYLPILTRMLCVEFSDEKSWSGLHAIVGRAWKGELDLGVIESAYREAMGPTVRNRGALFTSIVTRRG